MRRGVGDLLVCGDRADARALAHVPHARVREGGYGARVIECVKLPPYAPELNPVELAWRWLKSQGIGNRSPGSLDDLKRLWRKARQKFKTQVDVLALIKHALGA